MKQTKKTLVTGGAGFIGSHLTERLLRDEHEVIVLDNLENGRMQNLNGVKNNPHFTFHKIDINDNIGQYFKNVDWVFHLAGLADVVPSIINPMKYHCANVHGTVHVLEASRKAGVKRFVYAASSSCYGIPDNYPTTEEDPVRPQYPYALTKYLGEMYALHWHNVYKLPVISLRLFNVYGPRSRTSGTYGAVFGVFLKQKLAGKPFTVVGDGEQTRDFTFVTDVVEAFVRAAETEAISGEIFNVGSSNTYRINKLVELLGGEAVHIPKRPGEPDKTFADISKIRRHLHWEPQVSFEQGVRTMLEHIKYWADAPLWNEEKIAEATKEWFAYLGKR